MKQLIIGASMWPQDLVDKEILTAFNGNLPTVNVDATNLQATRDFFFKMKEV